MDSQSRMANMGYPVDGPSYSAILDNFHMVRYGSMEIADVAGS